jgi:phage terminase small subunit
MRIVKKEKKLMGRPRKNEDTPLTDKQIAFVKEFVAHDGMITKKQAAINAGYPEKSASVKASQLTDPRMHPNVCAAIKRYREELNEQYRVTYGRHVRDLQRIRDKALEDGAYSAAVQAEKARGQAQGDIYVSKTEIRHGSIDSMSREEVEKALEEIKRQYGASIINITPTEKTEKESGVELLPDLTPEPEETTA